MTQTDFKRQANQCADQLRNTTVCPLCKQLKAPDLDTLTGDTLEPFRLDPYCRDCVDGRTDEVLNHAGILKA
jgi:hypothetical protein